MTQSDAQRIVEDNFPKCCIEPMKDNPNILGEYRFWVEGTTPVKVDVDGNVYEGEPK